MKFILAHYQMTHDPVWFNVDHIMTVTVFNGGSAVRIGELAVIVDETPETLIRMINTDDWSKV